MVAPAKQRALKKSPSCESVNLAPGWITRSAHKTPFKVGKKVGGTLKSGDAAGRSEEVVERNVDTHHT